jgi:hypothetical protein
MAQTWLMAAMRRFTHRVGRAWRPKHANQASRHEHKPDQVSETQEYVLVHPNPRLFERIFLKLPFSRYGWDHCSTDSPGPSCNTASSHTRCTVQCAVRGQPPPSVTPGGPHPAHSRTSRCRSILPSTLSLSWAANLDMPERNAPSNRSMVLSHTEDIQWAPQNSLVLMRAQSRSG